MHDSMVEPNGARTGPALESGVTGSSGSFSKGLGATPVQPSNCLLALGEHTLCLSVQPLSEPTTARHLIAAPDHDIANETRLTGTGRSDET